MKQEKHYKPSEFAKKLGVSVRTLQRWDVEKKLIAFRTPTNRRFYTSQHLRDYQQQVRFKKRQQKSRIVHCKVTGREASEVLHRKIQALIHQASQQGIEVSYIRLEGTVKPHSK